MANKQIKDFQQTNSISNNELFLKSTADGGLSTIDFASLKSNIVGTGTANNSFFGAKVISDIGNPKSVTITPPSDNKWGICVLFFGDDLGTTITTALNPGKLSKDLGNGMTLLYDSSLGKYTISGMPQVLTIMMLGGGAALGSATFNTF